MAAEKLSPLGSELVEALQEVAAHVRGEIELPMRVAQVPDTVDVTTIRQHLHLSQRQFAARFGLTLSTVRDWEQGRRQPDRSARILLRVIEREGEAVVRALA
ncbi:MAG TPA: helix-turn-helix domain-containing protein [Thermoanaerobaculia bacterium]|nr:helix-turn-helix domain-containing protein [Thermoanaerobaculia bacterium]